MKLPMPEPQVSRDGNVYLNGKLAGRVEKHSNGSGWRAVVAQTWRRNGLACEAGGMQKRWQAVRWLIIQVVDWRLP